MNHIQAEIPDLQKPVLTVTGHSKSNLKEGAEFLKEAPLKVGKQLHNTVLSGPMAVNIKLYIPLHKTKKKKNHIIASGDVAVKDGTMQLKAWNTEFIHIKGVYHFVDNNLSAKHVTALLYGLPVVFNISTLDAKTPSPVLQVEAGGQLSMTSLQKRLKLPVLKYIQGMTTYRALVKIRDENSPLGTSFSLVSDLNGIATTLPPPYNKTAKRTKPFFVTMKTIHNKLLTVMLRYGNDFSIATSFNRSDNKLKFISGELLFGEGQARLQQLPGLLIDGKIEQVAWSQWKKYLDTYLKSSRLVSKIAWSHNTRIRRIKLQIDKLLLLKHTLHNTYLNLVPKSDGWSITVKNPIIAGNMYIPNDRDQCWYGHFSRLYLPKFKTKNKSNQTQERFDLHKIPPFYLTCDDFRYGGKDLGQVHIKSTPIQTGLKINQLTVKNNLFGISAIGTWQDEQGQQHSSLFGRFDSSNLGSVLKDWGITSALEGGGGFANFALRWPGSPHKFSTTKLSGSVNIDFQNGRVSQVSNGAESKLGLGRLLNLFSLQTLPLLPIKLAHLSKKGFAFNLMKGDFKLNHGNARTKNASIVGSVAWVRVHGDIEFARKNYDLQLNIVPNITSSLPLIVSIAGGPLAGAIAWVANKILGPQVGKAAQINYRVTGSWDKPSIIKIPAPAETNTHRT